MAALFVLLLGAPAAQAVPPTMSPTPAGANSSGFVAEGFTTGASSSYAGQSFTASGCPGQTVTLDATNGTLPNGLTDNGPTTGTLTVSGNFAGNQPVVNDPITVTATVSPAGTCTNTNFVGTTNGYTIPIVYRFAASKLGGSSAFPSAVSVQQGGDRSVYVAMSGTDQVFRITHGGNTNPPAATTTTDNQYPCASNTACSNGDPTFSLPGLNWPNGLVVPVPGTNNSVFATNFFGGASALSRTGAASADTLTGCSNAAGVDVGDKDFNFAGGAARAAIVACAGSNKIFEVNADTGAVSASALTLANGTNGTPAPAGVRHNPVDNFPTTTSPDETTVLVGDAQNDKLSIVGPTATGPALIETISLTSGCVPANIAAQVSGGSPRTVYVACPGNGTIDVVSIDNTAAGGFMTLGTPITAGNNATSRPFGVAVDSADNQLVLTNSGDDNVRVINTTTPASQATLPVGDVPDGVDMNPASVGPAGSLAYVSSENDGTVWVVDPPKAPKIKDKKDNQRTSAQTCDQASGEANVGDTTTTETTPTGTTPTETTPTETTPTQTTATAGDESEAEAEAGSGPQATASRHKHKNKNKNKGGDDCQSATEVSSRSDEGNNDSDMSVDDNIALLRSRARTHPLSPPVD